MHHYHIISADYSEPINYWNVNRNESTNAKKKEKISKALVNYAEADPIRPFILSLKENWSPGEVAGSEGNSRYRSGLGNEARLSAGEPGSTRQKPNRDSR